MTLHDMLANMRRVHWCAIRPAHGGEWEYALWAT